jgi:uncharacterized protein CbrC (UPF0167 family)
MKPINLKYFESFIEESVFESHDEDENCFFCGKTNSPIAELDGSLTIVANENIDNIKKVCLKCLLEKKYAFEQEVEGGFLTKEGLLLESDKYPYLKESSDYTSDVLPKEQLLISMDASKIRELMHTPPYSAWQGAKWLIHCNDFMKFIGTWVHEDFVKHASDGDAKSFFDQICDNGEDLYDSQFGLDKSAYAESTFYAFECPVCKEKRGYIDNA